MKKYVATVAALLLLGTAPAMAMSCCGGKGKSAMCAKGSGMAMNMKGKKGCCCDGMSGGNISRRT